jgi:hypothetical protein
MDMETVRARLASAERGAVDHIDRGEASPEETITDSSNNSTRLKKWTSLFREWCKRFFTHTGGQQ